MKHESSCSTPSQPMISQPDPYLDTREAEVDAPRSGSPGRGLRDSESDGSRGSSCESCHLCCDRYCDWGEGSINLRRWGRKMGAWLGNIDTGPECGCHRQCRRGAMRPHTRGGWHRVGLSVEGRGRERAAGIGERKIRCAPIGQPPGLGSPQPTPMAPQLITTSHALRPPHLSWCRLYPHPPCASTLPHHVPPISKSLFH